MTKPFMGEIESDIPIPKHKSVGLTKKIRSTEIGNSFLWEGETHLAHSHANNAHMKISCRRETPELIRIWRIS